eukprot:Clim_evm1s153 gene=Clim_evmTU1s153
MYSRHASTTVVATCILNQWALDFEGNFERILKSIQEAKAKGARLRTGPELEVTGYGCNDHFYEQDTYRHAWESFARLLEHPDCTDIIIDIGMPVMRKGVRYNCRVFFYNKEILLIRPKLFLANDGNYREMRWFTPYRRRMEISDYILPDFVSERTAKKQTTCPFGEGVIRSADGYCIGIESCEEVFVPEAPHISMALDGVDIFVNGSGSHHELRKLHRRVELVEGATRMSGGVYLFANQQGCDGERVYYDGCGMIYMNGRNLAQTSQFSLQDIEVITATVDLSEVHSYRGKSASRNIQASTARAFCRIDCEMRLCQETYAKPTPPRDIFYHTPQDEIRLGPACWLWDYLRRSGMGGFFLPLSGGIDSCATACIVGSMTELVYDSIVNKGDVQVRKDFQYLTGADPDDIKTPQHVCRLIFYTAFMGTSNSGPETRSRSKRLAEFIGSNHYDFNIDTAVQAVASIFTALSGKVPQFRVHGGSHVENVALQNIQARLRMVMAYLCAQLLPWSMDRRGGLLVLGSANVDECLRGYMTKYDCSSADVNPIGGISKTDLKAFIAHYRDHVKCDMLSEFLDAPPTAELEPITEDYVQTDEVDMGMTYDELSIFGRLRKISLCGPLSMFRHVASEGINGVMYSAAEVADKIKFWYRMYAINRHKMTTVTPAYHAESYSPDDNRFDLRPFLYPASFRWQFSAIDEEVKRLGSEE